MLMSPLYMYFFCNGSTQRKGAVMHVRKEQGLLYKKWQTGEGGGALIRKGGASTRSNYYRRHIFLLFLDTYMYIFTVT